MKEWTIKYDKVTDAQFGFKENHSTIDAIFILNHFIEEQIRNRKKLYCCFVDFQKAYDLINRNSLWYMMIKEGIDGKMFKVLPCRVGSVGSVSASRTVGREFATRPGHTKDHHKNGTNCLPA